MERIIKFRGIRCSLRYEGQDRWVYGNYVESSRSWHGRSPHKSWILPSPYTNGGWFSIAGATAVKDETVGQFTGVYDNDGKEVYEGDIVDCWSQGRHCTCGVVKYSATRFFISVMKNGNPCDIWNLSPSQFTGRDEGLYVIGNIHDNPELLKGGEK